MITYKLQAHNQRHYKVTSNGRVIYNAIRKQRLLMGDKVFFYDVDNQLIATSKHRYFLIVGFGHKVQFYNEGFSRVVRPSKAQFSLSYGSDTYSLKYAWFSMNNNLYLNNMEEGTFKMLNQANLTYEAEFSCNSETSCKIFSMLYIIQDWFTFN